MPNPKADMMRPWVREIGLSDFPDTTSGAMSAEARYMWQKRVDPGGCRHVMELITSVFLHLISQLFQFLLIVYFTLTMVEPMGVVFETSNVLNMTHQIKTAIAARNWMMLDPAIQAQCSMNQAYPMAHHLMMFLLMAKVIPDVGNLMWLFFNTWLGEDHRNGDRQTVEEAEIAKVFKFEEKDKLVKQLGNYHKNYTARIEHEKTWRDEDNVIKQWKARILLLNRFGNQLKVGKAKEFEKDDFPVMWIKQELAELHHIGHFGLPWKLFSTCFIIVPGLLMNIYMVKVGSQLIASIGALGKLTKTALKVKFLNSIPGAVFDGYASKELKEYIENASYYVRTDHQPTEPDNWNTWLSPAAKMLLALCMGIALYDWGYHDILAFRQVCSDYHSAFEDELAGKNSLFSFW